MCPVAGSPTLHQGVGKAASFDGPEFQPTGRMGCARSAWKLGLVSCLTALVSICGSNSSFNTGGFLFSFYSFSSGFNCLLPGTAYYYN